MVITAALLLVGITVFFILQPIITGREATSWRDGKEPSEAQFRKRVSLLQLRDAEYEYEMGKLGDEDYQALRSEIGAEALDAIRAEQEEDRGGSVAPGGGPTETELEKEISAVRSRLAGGGFCSNCGHPAPAGSRFCGDCGAEIQVPLDTPKA